MSDDAVLEDRLKARLERHKQTGGKKGKQSMFSGRKKKKSPQEHNNDYADDDDAWLKTVSETVDKDTPEHRESGAAARDIGGDVTKEKISQDSDEDANENDGTIEDDSIDMTRLQSLGNEEDDEKFLKRFETVAGLRDAAEDNTYVREHSASSLKESDLHDDHSNGVGSEVVDDDDAWIRDADMRRRNRNEASNETVNDRLYLDAVHRKRRSEREHERAELRIQQLPRKPNITPFAKRLNRDGNIGDRLFQDAQERRRRKERARKSTVRGRKSKAMRSSLKTPSRKQKDNLGHDLHRRATLTQIKKERKIEEARRDAKLNARPMLNKRSLRMASQDSRSGLDRLTARKNTIEGTMGQRDQDLTFRPKLSKRSVAISRRRDGGMTGARRYDHLFRDQERRLGKLEKLRREKELDERAKCPFTPRIFEHSSSRRARELAASKTVLERMDHWQQKRERKLAREREKRKNLDEEFFPFRPQLVARRNASKSEDGCENPEAAGPAESIVLRLSRVLAFPHAEERLMFDLTSKDFDRSGTVSREDFLDAVRALRVHMTTEHEVHLVKLLQDDAGDIPYTSLRSTLKKVQGRVVDSVEGAKLKDVETVHPGISRFLKRQTRARKMRQQRRSIPHCNGDAWTKETTVPVAFTFSQSCRKSRSTKSATASKPRRSKQERFTSSRKQMRSTTKQRERIDSRKKDVGSATGEKTEGRSSGPGRARNLYSSDVKTLVRESSDSKCDNGIRAELGDDVYRKLKYETAAAWERSAAKKLERHVQDCVEQAAKVFDSELRERPSQAKKTVVSGRSPPAGAMFSPRERWAQLISKNARKNGTEIESKRSDTRALNGGNESDLVERVLDNVEGRLREFDKKKASAEGGERGSSFPFFPEKSARETESAFDRRIRMIRESGLY